MTECDGGARVAKLQSTKLIQSVRRNDVSQLEAVLIHGVPELVNLLHPIYDNSALIVAASEGSTEIVDLLLCRGANPDLKDTEGRTALMHAAGQGHVDCVVKLIESGAISVVTEDHDKCGICCRFVYYILAARYWHHNVVRPSVRPSVCNPAHCGKTSQKCLSK